MSEEPIKKLDEKTARQIQEKLADGSLIIVPITASREIHVQRSEYKGKPVLDIRTFVKSPTFTGYTPKGINIPLNNGQELLETLQKILQGAK